MQRVSAFNVGHDDLVHDIAYDYYGTRLVTCSSDQRVKVWDADEAGGWVLNDSWKAHDSSVVKVDWAHPEFGHVFASCSFDRTIRVWEEQEQHDQRKTDRKWIERAKLADSKGSVHDIQFAPYHIGLKLASVGADGVMRIYEALDVVNLTQWTLMDDIEIVAGGSKESDGPYCLSWCQSRTEPQMLVVGCGRDHTAKIYRIDAHNKWQPYEVLPGHGDVVTDVAWAPSMGRSFHLIATACKDGHVRIFKLTDENAGMSASALQGVGPTRRRFRVELMADLTEHGAEVWRVEWNVTGTILSSSGDDGHVRLWKASVLNKWRLFGYVGAETADAAQSAHGVVGAASK
ncbi:WD40-repeat-containing domain protein [Entophlyctis helioformis]|nr:WD40-repeat-containing domain protein [Entophlyctis helioformis]